MDYAEFQQTIRNAGLSIGEFAELIKQRPNSITNYSHLGYVPSHLAVIAALLQELARHDIPFRPVLEALDLKAKAPRGKKFAGAE